MSVSIALQIAVDAAATDIECLEAHLQAVLRMARRHEQRDHMPNAWHEAIEAAEDYLARREAVQ